MKVKYDAISFLKELTSNLLNHLKHILHQISQQFNLRTHAHGNSIYDEPEVKTHQ